MDQALSSCLLCGTPRGDDGFPACTHTDAEYLKLRELERAQEDRAKFKAALITSIPLRYRDYLSGLPAEIGQLNPEALAASRSLSTSSVLYLHGEGGIGKTHLAVRGMVRLHAQTGCSALFVDEDKYFEQVEASYGGGRPAPDIITPQVIVYDDFGKKPPSANAARLVYRILNRRLVERKATLITSNRSPELVAAALAQHEGEMTAILSRIRAGQVFEMIGTRDGREGSAV